MPEKSAENTKGKKSLRYMFSKSTKPQTEP